MIEYPGRCHCGALTVRYRTALERGVWPLRACQCSFCRLHGALSTSDPHGLLAFESADMSLVQRYRFGGRTADFLVCRACGVYMGAQMACERGRLGVLNVRCLLPERPDLIKAEPMDYSTESPEFRLQRRVARWTPLAPESL